LNLSQGKRFHGLFSANSIEEAVAYYHVFKDKTDLKVNALFDPSIDNVEKAFDKESSLLSLLEDYNKEYGVNFSLSNYDAYKKDVCARLAHKHAYKNLEKGKEIDLLIVVNQLLTGFDSPWINTLYLDRLLEYENLIQAFSRTNRLFGPEKPFGNIRYYRKPHTMKSNIEKAVKLYSGDKPLGLFVDHLLDNILHINQLFDDIASIFKSAGIENFASVPKEPAYKKEFVKKFNELTGYLEAARIQGFTWDKSDYSLVDEDTGETKNVTSKLSRSDFKKLQERYIEILQSRKVDPDPHPESIPFDINPYLMEFLTGTIDADYMNSKFEKYRRLLVESPEDKALLQEACGELHKTFAELSHEDQKYAMFFLHAVEDGIVKPDPNKTFRDYLNEAKVRALDMGIKVMADRIGVDALLLDELIKASPSAENVNEFGRFDRLMQGIDLSKSQNFLEAQTGKRPSPFGTRVLIQKLLRNFILQPTVDEEIMQESVKG
jgi:type I restriction enzyme R subunit